MPKWVALLAGVAAGGAMVCWVHLLVAMIGRPLRDAGMVAHLVVWSPRAPLAPNALVVAALAGAGVGLLGTRRPIGVLLLVGATFFGFVFPLLILLSREP